MKKTILLVSLSVSLCVWAYPYFSLNRNNYAKTYYPYIQTMYNDTSSDGGLWDDFFYDVLVTDANGILRGERASNGTLLLVAALNQTINILRETPFQAAAGTPYEGFIGELNRSTNKNYRTFLKKETIEGIRDNLLGFLKSTSVYFGTNGAHYSSFCYDASSLLGFQNTDFKRFEFLPLNNWAATENSVTWDVGDFGGGGKNFNWGLFASNNNVVVDNIIVETVRDEINSLVFDNSAYVTNVYSDTLKDTDISQWYSNLFLRGKYIAEMGWSYPLSWLDICYSAFIVGNFRLLYFWQTKPLDVTVKKTKVNYSYSFDMGKITDAIEQYKIDHADTNPLDWGNLVIPDAIVETKEETEETEDVTGNSLSVLCKQGARNPSVTLQCATGQFDLSSWDITDVLNNSEIEVASAYATQDIVEGDSVQTYTVEGTVYKVSYLPAVGALGGVGEEITGAFSQELYEITDFDFVRPTDPVYSYLINDADSVNGGVVYSREKNLTTDRECHITFVPCASKLAYIYERGISFFLDDYSSLTNALTQDFVDRKEDLEPPLNVIVNMAQFAGGGTGEGMTFYYFISNDGEQELQGWASWSDTNLNGVQDSGDYWNVTSEAPQGSVYGGGIDVTVDGNLGDIKQIDRSLKYKVMPLGYAVPCQGFIEGY